MPQVIVNIVWVLYMCSLHIIYVLIYVLPHIKILQRFGRYVYSILHMWYGICFFKVHWTVSCHYDIIVIRLVFGQSSQWITVKNMVWDIWSMLYICTCAISVIYHKAYIIAKIVSLIVIQVMLSLYALSVSPMDRINICFLGDR